MKRWHSDMHKIKPKVCSALALFELNSPKRRQLGRYRKRKPGDCGNTKCHICHYNKIIDDKTRAMLIADINFKEQLE